MHCSKVRTIRTRKGLACGKFYFPANRAAMSARDLRQSNCLGAGYSPEPVFVGRGCGGLEEFAGRIDLVDLAPGGRQCSISAGRQLLGGRAGRSIGRPASITEKQALSCSADLAVATGPSQRASGSAESCGFAVPGRLIASYRTAAQLGAARLPIGAPGADQAGGGVPPFRRARTPYAGRAHRAGILENPSQGPGPRPARDESPSGQNEASRGRGRKVSRWQTGSGVWPAPSREKLGAKTRANGRNLRNRVGVSHRAFDLGRSANSATGRG